MGQIVVEIPMDVERNYSIADVEKASALLDELSEFLDDTPRGANPAKWKTPAIEPPRRHSLEADLEAVRGLWADRPETGEEISRRIRDRNNGKI